MSKRRSHGEGGIRQRKDGRWEATLYVEVDGGGKDRKHFYGRTKRDAVQKLNQAKASLDQGHDIVSARLCVGDLLDAWLAATSTSVRPRTWQRYEQYVRLYLRPQLGHIRAAKLDPGDIDQMHIRLRASGLSLTTCGHIHRALHAVLKLAMLRNRVHRNVTELASAPRPDPNEVEPLSIDQVVQLIRAAERDPLGALYIVAVTTGLRQGELLGLRWTAVDLDAGTLEVVGSLQRLPDGRLEIVETKTRSSRRTVNLPDQAVVALKRHKAAQAAERLRVGPSWNDLDLVFPNGLGRPINASNLLRRSFRPFLVRAGLPPIRFHDLRHTCATIHLARGANVKVVAELLGHSDVMTTLRTYSHVMPTMQAETVEAFNDQLAVKLAVNGPQPL